MVRKENLEYFKDLVDHYEYKKAAEMYYNLAHWYRDDFNKILNERNRKDAVVDLVYDLYLDVLYVEDQPEETL